jgi:uncharacterized protein (TIGR03546 family)
MIKAIAKLILALNGNQKKTEIAAGFAWGALFGLVPAGNAVWIALFIVSFFLRHNQGAKIVTLAVLKLLMPLIAPLTDELGWMILNAPQLYPYFTYLYNTPVVLFTRFNNTLVTGGLALGLVLWLPLFGAFIALISGYRRSALPKMFNSGLAKTSGNFPLIEKIKKAIDFFSAFTGE